MKPFIARAAGMAGEGVSRRRRTRGMSILEVLIAGSISAAVTGIAIGVYVTGTRSYYREQAQSYVQFRTRVSLDSISKEIRSAKSFLTSYGSYTASTGVVSPACVIMVVPSQDSSDMSIFYYGATSGTPNAIVTDVIIYRHDRTNRTLLCTVVPTHNVLASDGQVRSSYRTAMTNQVVAQNVDSLRFAFRDRNGNYISYGRENRTAAVDILARVGQANATGGNGAVSSVAISGVRLRNMKSGSIPGIVTGAGAPLPNAKIQAIYTSTSGAYAPGTVVGETYTDSTGSFEIYGLEPGTYTVKAVSSTFSTTTVTGVAVPEEEASEPVTVKML